MFATVLAPCPLPFAHVHVRDGKTLYSVIDEAHLIDITALRKLRLLFERFPRKHLLVLLGQPELLHALSLLPNADIKTRITYSAHLLPLTDEHLRDWIGAELAAVRLGANTFDDAATELILRNAQGNLRLTRHLCHGSLIEACRDSKRLRLHQPRQRRPHPTPLALTRTTHQRPDQMSRSDPPTAMALKLAQLPLHLSPDEAHTLIDFLAQLQDLLWAQYGAQIQRACRTDDCRDHRHPEPDFDDPLPTSLGRAPPVPTTLRRSGACGASAAYSRDETHPVTKAGASGQGPNRRGGQSLVNPALSG